MKNLIFSFLLIFPVLTGFSQHRFSENKGQLPEHVEFKCRLNYGALFLEKDGLVYHFADKTQYEHSHAHHGEGSVDDAHHAHSHEQTTQLDFHAYKMHFVGASDAVQVSGKYPLRDYENYFVGNNPDNWARRVARFEQVCYEALYPNIDLCFYDQGSGLKYDFILNPGANPADIQLRYEGVDDIKLRFGNLILKTSLSKTTELHPDAYQIINGDSIPVRCKYTLNDQVLGYTFPDGYDKSEALIIDPSLVFSTYTGSTGDNWGFTATWDYNDNVFSGGIVFDIGYPVSLGAYQTDMAGGVAPNPNNPGYYGNGCDVGIIKYNEDGTERLFATYLGGSTGEEMPHSMVVNEYNELVVFGTTGSSDFPTYNAYDDTFNGGDSINYDNVIAFPDGTDIFLVKFSEDGTDLLGGTYLGGSANDGLNFKIEYTEQGYIQMHGNDSLYYNYGDGARGEVIADDKNYIYIGANTFSDDIMPGASNGFQTANAGGMDGLVAKFSPDLSVMMWMSYLGGIQDDAIYSITPDENYSVLVSGGTCSSDFPTTSGAFAETYHGGSTDAFVSKIHQNGNTLLASTFFGSSAYDQAHFVRVDNDDKVYIYGQTEASGSTLIYNVGYSVPNSGQFLASFTNDLSTRLWSTVFGRGAGHPVLSPSAFAVDVCDRIYLAGWGREWAYSYLDETNTYYTWEDDYGTKGLPLTADALQSETDGQDFYIMVLSENAGALEYATFFGEVHYGTCGYSGHDHVDGGTSRFDKKGNVIQSVCASCGSCQEFPTMPNPGVWSTENSSSNCNNAVFKINIIENLAEANFNPIPAICAPFDVEFENTSQGVEFTWDFGDGSPQSNEFEPTHTYTEEGVYEVMLIAFDPAACNYADTAFREIEVHIPETIELAPIEICPGESVQIGPTEHYGADVSFDWVSGSGLSETGVQNPIASPTETSEYTLIVYDVCIDSVFQTIEIIDVDVELILPPDTLICPGDPVELNAEVLGDYTDIQWSDNASFTNLLSTNLSMSDVPTGNTTYYVQVTESLCNTDVVNSVTVNLHAFNYQLSADPIICVGESVELSINNLNPSDVNTYTWSPVGFIVSGENTANPLVAPTENTTFTVNIENQMGCTETAEVLVTIDDIQISSIIPEHPLCYGECTGAVSAIANGYPPYSFSWSNGSSGETVNGLCAGNYDVTVVDEIGCEANASVQIVQPPQLNTQFVDIVDPLCDGIGFGAATVSVSGGTPGYFYQWDDGTVTANNNSLHTGIHEVQVIDANGCDTILEIEMVPPNNLATSLSDVENNLCYGDCEGQMTVNVSGGTPPFNYVWTNGDSQASISDLCAGYYQVTVVDADNCVIHENGYITSPTEINMQVLADPILCYGDSTSIDLQATGGTFPYDYQWSTGASGQSLEAVTAGQYSVTLTDDHNCVDSTSITLVQPELLEFTSTVDNMLCTGVCNGEIHVNASGGTGAYEYHWSVDGDSSDLVGLCTGDYELLLRDENGCETYGEFFIENESYVPPLEVSTDNPEIYVGMSTNLFGTDSDGYSYDWYPANSILEDGLPQVEAWPTETTTYELRITDANGCVNVDTITIIVNELICGEPYLYIPNAFTPNADGENDYFKPYAPIGVVRKMYFAVYDRWGEIIYESENINDRGWDGTFRGKELPPDVYIYYFEATCIDEDFFSKKGNVTLLR
jgi:gliding motility-associated-like protein